MNHWPGEKEGGTARQITPRLHTHALSETLYTRVLHTHTRISAVHDVCMCACVCACVCPGVCVCVLLRCEDKQTRHTGNKPRNKTRIIVQLSETATAPAPEVSAVGGTTSGTRVGLRVGLEWDYEWDYEWD